MSAVRPIGPLRRPPGVRFGVPAAVAGVTIAVLLTIALLVLAGTWGSRLSAPEPPPDLTGSSPLPIEVAYELDGLLRVGDARAAADLFADRPSRLVLPGLPLAFVPEFATADEVEVGLGFFTEMLAIETTNCRIDDPYRASLTQTSTRVVCDAIVAETPFAEVGLIAGRTVPVVYWMDGEGRITGALRGVTGTPMLHDYCFWLETTGATAGIMDSDCIPMATPTSAAAHQALAGEYLAAGRPTQGRRYWATRSDVSAVSHMIERHNRGLSASTWTRPDAPSTGFPGMIGGAAATLEEYLDWSRVVYRIEPGRCFVDATANPRFEVSCPDARWRGPLVEGLTLDPLHQPVAFTVDGSAVVAAAGTTQPSLVHAFGRFCGWVYERHPEAVPVLFSTDCTPIYTAESAGSLLVVLSAYTSDPR